MLTELFMKKQKTLNIVIIALISILHFSYPLIITYDTAHYHMLENIINNELSWSNWDQARGIVFPMLLYYAHFSFGHNEIGILLLTYIFYLILSFTAIHFVNILFESMKDKITASIFIIVLLVFDPLIIGYYHLLLTEFVSASIAMLSCYLAWKWCNVSIFESSTRKKFILYSVYFLIMVPLSYHLKPLYVTITLLPLLAAIFISSIKSVCIHNYMQRFLVLVFSIILLLLSVLLWNSFLLKKNINDQSRQASNMLSEQIIRGLRQFEVSDVLEGYSNNSIKNDSYFSNTEKTRIMKLLNDKNYRENSLVISVYDINNNLYSKFVLKLNKEEVNIFDSLRLWFKCVFKHPIMVTHGYIKNYFGIANAYKVLDNNYLKYAELNEDFSLIRGFQNEILAYRIANIDMKNSNIYGVPNSMMENVKNYIRTRSIHPILKAYINVFKCKSNFLYTVLLLLLPFYAIFSFTRIVSIREFANNDDIKNKFIGIYEVNFILSFVSLFHVLAHVFTNSIIDRYVFAIYPLLLILLVIFIILIIKEGVFMSTLKKYKTAIIYVTIGVTIGLILSPFIYNNKSHNVEGSANEYIYELDANKVIAEQGIAESLVGMITKDNIITQTISFRDNAKIKYLGILVGTYQRSNQGNLTLELLDNSNNLVYSNTINKQQLTDNSYYYVDFKYTKVYENIDYKLVIKDDTDKNNAITLYCSKENVFNGGHLEVNSVSQVSDLTFKIVGKNFNR